MPDAGDRQDFAGATSTGVDPRLSALLCYTAWWISGLVFLVIEQQNREVRFHAAQSVVVFGALSLLIGLISVASAAMVLVSVNAFMAAWFLARVVWIVAVVIWLIVMVKTLKGETWRIPFATPFALRLAGER